MKRKVSRKKGDVQKKRGGVSFFKGFTVLQNEVMTVSFFLHEKSGDPIAWGIFYLTRCTWMLRELQSNQ